MQMARKVVAAGQDITAIVNALFVSLVIEDKAGREADSLTLTLFDDGNFTFPAAEADLDIWTGPNPERLTYKGRFTVEDIRLPFPENQIVIQASGAKVRGPIKHHRNATWPADNLYNVATVVAERAGLAPAISEDLKAIPTPHIVQKGQSDADLLQQLVDENDCTLKCSSGRMIVFPLGDNRNVGGESLPTVPVTLSDQVKGNILISGRSSVEGVKAAYRDLDSAELRYEAAGDANGQLKQLPGEYTSQAAALSAAKSEMHRAERAGYELNISEMPAIPSIQAEREILVSGHHRSQFNGAWMVDSMTETQDQNGWVQSLKAVVPKANSAKVPNLIKRT